MGGRMGRDVVQDAGQDAALDLLEQGAGFLDQPLGAVGLGDAVGQVVVGVGVGTAG